MGNIKLAEELRAWTRCQGQITSVLKIVIDLWTDGTTTPYDRPMPESSGQRAVWWSRRWHSTCVNVHASNVFAQAAWCLRAVVESSLMYWIQAQACYDCPVLMVVAYDVV